MRISADRKGSCNGVIRLTDMHNGKIELSDQKITGVGKLENGLMYESGVIALNDGGEVKVSENALKFERANSITIILAAGTNYLPDYSRGWRGENPHRLVEQQLKAASLLTFNKLRERHIADYQSLFTRVDLNIGESELAVTTLPTDQRLVAFKKGGNDPDLEELFFQYGRYLLISSSRPGSLPANLQGIWNNSNKPPWRSDYHSNINVQMNYWPAEVTNLSECHIPFGIY
jgi:alpha-L-fucosidase 2